MYGGSVLLPHPLLSVLLFVASPRKTDKDFGPKSSIICDLLFIKRIRANDNN